MGGRKYLGHSFEHLRCEWRSENRTRGFFARWRENLRCWECCVSGYGMRPFRFFSACQTAALFRVSLNGSLWGADWKFHIVDWSPAWDGISDRNVTDGGQFDFGFGVDGSYRVPNLGVDAHNPVVSTPVVLPGYVARQVDRSMQARRFLRGRA